MIQKESMKLNLKKKCSQFLTTLAKAKNRRVYVWLAIELNEAS